MEILTVQTMIVVVSLGVEYLELYLDALKESTLVIDLGSDSSPWFCEACLFFPKKSLPFNLVHSFC